MTSASAKSDRTQKPPVEHEILFQNWFKSVGPRTYAAQLKKAGNGNHFLVLTEGNRGKETGEIRKTRLFVYSEDFVAFFRMLHEAAVFIRENPLPEEVKRRQEKYWAKQNSSKGQTASDRAPMRDARDDGGRGKPGFPAREDAGRYPRAQNHANDRPPERRPAPPPRPARQATRAMQPA